MIGILLAAGRGTRMKSDRPKVLFPVNDEPLCTAPLSVLFEVCEKVIVVVGYRGEDVREALQARATEIFGVEAVRAKLMFFTQNPPKGTGDAVRTAMEGLGKAAAHAEETVVLNGDLPLIRTRTLKKLIEDSRKAKLASACFSTVTGQPSGLGRILRDDRGSFTGIKEEKDATPEQKRIREVNSGVYYFKTELLLKNISQLKSNNEQNEFYLTDLLGNRISHGPRSEAIPCRDPWDLMGVNTTAELGAVRKIAQYRLQKKLCENFGLDFENMETTFVSARTQFLGDCTIGSNAQITGRSVIEKGVVIEANCQIKESKIQGGARILWGTVVESSLIGLEAQVGPMAHIRPDSEVGEGARVGNFVELKKTKMGARSKAAHLTYLGDADVGEEANIGCGSITCNYDGFNKYPTKIGKRAFVGSDTQMLAPIVIGDDAYVASGTTLTQDVPSGALALSRPELIVKLGYAKRLSEKLLSKKKKG